MWLGLAALAVAAAVQGIFLLVTPAGARPVPWLAALPWVIACFAGPALVASLVRSLRSATGGLARLGAVTLHLVLAVGGVIGLLAADPDFPFGPTHAESLALPDGRGTAHLYRGGLFCDQSVWRAGPGDLWAHPDPAASLATCERHGHLRWDAAQGKVLVVGADGRTLPGPRHLDGLGEALDWGPH